MRIESIALTHEGRVRENNEDNYFVCGKYKKDVLLNRHGTEHNEICEEYLYAVCDGMGGEEFGERASLIAVEILNEYWQNNFFDINDYVKKTNDKICDEIENNNGTRMGTTLAVLYIKDNTAHAYNIGDSRIYLFRKNKLEQISKDHTQTERLIRMNIITPEEAKNHPERHKLTQHLGIFPEEMIIEPFESEIRVNVGDIFLICSDGITDMLCDEEICKLLRKANSIKECLKLLISKAIKKGGTDNVTAVIVKVLE